MKFHCNNRTNRTKYGWYSQRKAVWFTSFSSLLCCSAELNSSKRSPRRVFSDLFALFVKVRGTDGEISVQPLKRPLTFCDKGLEGDKIFCTSFAWPAYQVWQFIVLSQSIAIYVFRGSKQCSISLSKKMFGPGYVPNCPTQPTGT